MRVGLVACSKTKADGARAACDLYASPLFRKAAAYCRDNYDRWFVLSALHGLVDPDAVLEPYEHTLVGRPLGERQAWAAGVVDRLARLGLRDATFYVHAGREYAGVLTDKLTCVLPLAGLGIGEQLAWYGRKMMSKVLTIPALQVRQGERVLYTFAVDGKRLHDFAAVSRVGRDEGGAILGYQRPEVLAHIKEIRAYLESEDALLPNSVVLAFNEPIAFRPCGKDSGCSRLGQLTIPLGGEKAAWIVDGQQRAAAVREMNRESFPVCVTAFVARDTNEQREQFILVNATKPLPKGLVHELLPQTDAQLPPRLAKHRFPALLLDRLNRDEGSPLLGRIKTPTCPDGVIKDTSVLTVLNNSLTDGVLYLFRDRATGGCDIEGMLRVLKAYWSAVASVFAEAWDRPPRLSRLTHGAGFVALGFVMDEVVDSLREEGLPTRTRFVEELHRLAPLCRWTPESGHWDLDGFQRRWDEVQNTPKDVRLLTTVLCRAYRRLTRGR